MASLYSTTKLAFFKPKSLSILPSIIMASLYSTTKLAFFTVCLLSVLALAQLVLVAAHGPESLSFFMYVAVKNETLPNNTAPFTAILSAQPAQPQDNAFGVIHTFDNPLMTEASLNATQIGRVQGWYGDVGQQNLTLLLCQTFTIATADYSGTFSLLGVDVATDLFKLSPVVGGTGDFAFVRGVANQTLVSTAVVENETVSWFYYSVQFRY